MIDVSVVREMPFPEQVVWTKLSNFSDLTWTEGWDKLETEGEGIGMIRRVIIKGMDPIEEILQVMDHDTQSFSYTIPNMPLPVEDYRADVSVASGADGMAKVTWRCTAQAAGVSEEDAQVMLQATYAQLLDWLEKALAAQA